MTPRTLHALCILATSSAACIADTALDFERADAPATADDSDSGTSMTTPDMPPEEPAYMETEMGFVFEAERFSEQRTGSEDAVNHQWALMDPAPEGFSGASAMHAIPNTGINAQDTTLGPSMAYDFRVVTPGTHYVWLRLWSNNGDNNSVHIGLDGEPQSFSRWGMRLPKNQRSVWAWTNTRSDDLGEDVVSMEIDSPGVHTLDVWMREDGSVVDKIILTRDASFVPDGPGPSASELQ